MNMIVLPVFVAGAMAAISPEFGWPAHAFLLLMLLIMQGTGLAVGHWLGQKTNPFLALITGFVILAYALLMGDAVSPGVHPVLVWACILPAGAGFYREYRQNSGPFDTRSLTLSALVALYVFVWSADLQTQVHDFHIAGTFPFWLDMVVHAGTLAQFSEPAELGRGMLLMADVPRPLYHLASYMPSALLPPLAGISPLDTAILVWQPLGMVLLACGCVALGLTLGGPVLAALGVIALSAIPDMGRFLLGHWFLSFDWQLDASPGTGYSIGVACASLSALISWMRDQRRATLALALGLMDSCFLVRVNIFVWLAPTIVLGGVAGFKGLNIKTREMLVVMGLLGLVSALLFLSWRDVVEDPIVFVFGYVEVMQKYKDPTQTFVIYEFLSPYLSIAGRGFLSAALTLLEISGWWLILFVLMGYRLWQRKKLESIDALPWIALAVAVIFMFLGPMARNGDITEFRHRANPLLVVVLIVWSLRYKGLSFAAFLSRISWMHSRIALVLSAALSLFVLSNTVNAARRPDLSRDEGYYHFQNLPQLMRLAPFLHNSADIKPRFVVAHQPQDTRTMDDAALLVTLSGIPAYIACPKYVLDLDGAVGAEANMRMSIVARLDQAPDLARLQALMRAEGITYYIANSENDAPFDPQRTHAIGRAGPYAVYAADR